MGKDQLGISSQEKDLKAAPRMRSRTAQTHSSQQRSTPLPSLYSYPPPRFYPAFFYYLYRTIREKLAALHLKHGAALRGEGGGSRNTALPLCPPTAFTCKSLPARRSRLGARSAPAPAPRLPGLSAAAPLAPASAAPGRSACACIVCVYRVCVCECV